MPRNHCFIPGCKSGYDETEFKNKMKNLRNPTLFKASNRGILLKWQQVTSSMGKLFTEEDKICELHFEENNLDRYYVTTLLDGNISKIPRVSPKLHADATPSIFPNSPSWDLRVQSAELFLRKNAQSSDSISTQYVHAVENSVQKITVMSTSPSDDIHTILPRDSLEVNSDNCSLHTIRSSGVTTKRNKNDSCIEKYDLMSMNEVISPQNVSTFGSNNYSPIKMVNTPNSNSAKLKESFPINQIPSEHISFIQQVKSVTLPSEHWFFNSVKNKAIWTCWRQDLLSLAKRILMYEDKSLKIFIEEREIVIPEFIKVENVNDIQKMLNHVAALVPCQGPRFNTRTDKCVGFVVPKSCHTSGPHSKRCGICSKLSKRLMKKLNDNNYKKSKNLWNRLRNTKKKNLRMRKKMNKLQTIVTNLRNKCATMNIEGIDNIISKLPDQQKVLVKSCIAASKVRNAKGMRYVQHWILQCLLIRIKSRKTYEYLRENKILPLPSVNTLNRYIRKLKGSFGFQNEFFDLLRTKTANMDSREKHGVLLIDEMKLSKTVSFNQKQLKFEGFINLGKYTPLHDKHKRGDHALVLMFQPFQGKWVQSLACFLSKGCASSTVLHQIIIECIILTGKAGLYIDVVTTDGASWNRAMWNLFGITQDNVSCTHVLDPSRRLWFISDFPHLIKCLRNFLTSLEENWTPDGIIKLKHWDTLLKIENPTGFNLKANHKLTPAHVRPKYYQKMNVAMAFQFFGVSDAMKLYEKEDADLEDSTSTQTFCRRIKNLITAMNSRTPKGALKIQNEAYQTIEEFLIYLQNWEKEATRLNCAFMSKSTCEGLKISLQGTLEICKYLVSCCGFNYVMAARLNQDALERFFGIMRNACGQNDHPNSVLFIQMYRLIATYSLIKPQKGSNIQSNDILSTLLNITDIPDNEERKSQWYAQLDTILDKGENMSILPAAISILQEHDYFQEEKSQILDVTKDHDYHLHTTSDYILAYVAGYIAKKSNRFVNFKNQTNNKNEVCDNCMETLKLTLTDTEGIPEHYRLIAIKTKGYLTYPSEQLFSLISVLEKAILETLNNETSNENTLFDVTSCLERIRSLPFVGCPNHYLVLSKNIISYFLIVRMQFIYKEFNQIENLEQEKTKEKRKAAKLCTVRDETDLSKKTSVLVLSNKQVVDKKEKKISIQRNNKPAKLDTPRSIPKMIDSNKIPQKAPASSA